MDGICLGILGVGGGGVGSGGNGGGGSFFGSGIAPNSGTAMVVNTQHFPVR